MDFLTILNIHNQNELDKKLFGEYAYRPMPEPGALCLTKTELGYMRSTVTRVGATSFDTEFALRCPQPDGTIVYIVHTMDDIPLNRFRPIES